MAIAFACPHCSARYEVELRLAGRKARCKSCKGQMLVPLRSTETAASRQPVAAGAASKSTSPDSMFPTNIGLAPLDEDDLKPGARESLKQKERKFSYNPALDDSSSAALPQLVPTHIALPNLRRHPSTKPPNPVYVAWRQLITGQIKILRKISDFAYLLTIPFLLLFIIGILLRREHLAYPAALAILLINIGRLVLDGAALVSVPFKDGPAKGLIFLIPPFTFVYLAQNWRKMKKAFLRFLSPAVPILGVLLAFAFIPWLHTGGKDDKLERLREQIASAESAVGVSDQRLQGLERRASEGVQQIRQAAEAKKALVKGRP